VHKRFEEWRKAFIAKLCAAYRVGHIALRDMEDWDKLTEREALAIKWREALEYWGDCLLYGDTATQMGIFRDRTGVKTLCNQILSNSGTKSKTA